MYLFSGPLSTIFVQTTCIPLRPKMGPPQWGHMFNIVFYRGKHEKSTCLKP